MKTRGVKNVPPVTDMTLEHITQLTVCVEDALMPEVSVLLDVNEIDRTGTDIPLYRDLFSDSAEKCNK